MKRIVQAFQYIFLCIALSSGGMSPLIGAANDDVVEKIKNALSELAIAYKKNDKKNEAQEVLKTLLIAHKNDINKDLKFKHTTYKEKSSSWYSFFGSSEEELETDISLSVIMFALVYVPESLEWFNRLESENKEIVFEISVEQQKYLDLLLDNNLKVKGSNKETLKKRLADWMSWQKMRTDLQALSIDTFKDLSKEDFDQQIKTKKEFFQALIDAMDADNRYSFIQKSVDAAIKEIKDEYHKRSVQGKLERFNEIKVMKFPVGTESTSIQPLIGEIASMQNLLKDENGYKDNKDALIAKLTKKMASLKEQEEHWGKKLSEKDQAEAERLEASRKKKEEKRIRLEEEAKKKLEAKTHKRLTREDEKRKQEEELNQLKAELEAQKDQEAKVREELSQAEEKLKKAKRKKDQSKDVVLRLEADVAAAKEEVVKEQKDKENINKMIIDQVRKKKEYLDDIKKTYTLKKVTPPEVKNIVVEEGMKKRQFVQTVKRSIIPVLHAISQNKSDNDLIKIESDRGVEVDQKLSIAKDLAAVQVTSLKDRINEDIIFNQTNFGFFWDSKEELQLSLVMYALMYSPEGFVWLQAIAESNSIDLKISKEQFDRLNGYIGEAKIRNGLSLEKNKENLKKLYDAQDEGKEVVLRPSGEVVLSGSHFQEIQDARTILEIAEDEDITESLVKKKFREIARKKHTDKSGLSGDMSPLQQARDLLLKEIGVPTLVLPPAKSINVSGEITWQEFDRQKIVKGLRSDHIQNKFGSRINAENPLNQSNFNQKIKNKMRPAESHEAAIRKSKDRSGVRDERLSTSGRPKHTESTSGTFDADAGETLWNEKYKPLKTGAHVSAMIEGKSKWQVAATDESSRDQQMLRNPAVLRKPAIVTSAQVKNLREEKRKEAAQKAAEAAKLAPAVVGDPDPVVVIPAMSKEERTRIAAGLRSSWMTDNGREYMISFKQGEKFMNATEKFIAEKHKRGIQKDKELLVKKGSAGKGLDELNRRRDRSRLEQAKKAQRDLQDSNIKYKGMDLRTIFPDDEGAEEIKEKSQQGKGSHDTSDVQIVYGNFKNFVLPCLKAIHDEVKDNEQVGFTYYADSLLSGKQSLMLQGLKDLCRQYLKWENVRIHINDDIKFKFGDYDLDLSLLTYTLIYFPHSLAWLQSVVVEDALQISDTQYEKVKEYLGFKNDVLPIIVETSNNTNEDRLARIDAFRKKQKTISTGYVSSVLLPSPKGSPLLTGGSRGLRSPAVTPLDLGPSASSGHEERSKIVRGLELLHGDNGFFNIKNKKGLQRECNAALQEIRSSSVTSPSSPRLSPIRSLIDEPRTPHVRSRTPGRRSLDDSDLKRSSRDVAKSKSLEVGDTPRTKLFDKSPLNLTKRSSSTSRSIPSSPLLTPRLPFSRTYDFSDEDDQKLAAKGLRNDDVQDKLYEICKEADGSVTVEKIQETVRLSPMRSPLRSPDFSPFVSPENSPRADLISSSPPMSPLTPLLSPKTITKDDEGFLLPAATLSSSLSSSSSGDAKRLDDYFTFNQEAFERMMESK